MNISKCNKFVFFSLFIFNLSFRLESQNQLPLNIPIQTNNMPLWAHFLFKNPINLVSLEKEYKSYYNNHPFEKNNYTRYYKRLIMNNRMLLDENGNIVVPDFQLKEKVNHLSLSPRSPVNEWKPYQMETFFLENNQQACPWQTNVYKIDVCRSNPNFLVAASETGGIFKTNDKGLSWKQIGLPFFLGTEAIAIHPRSTDTIYIGTDGAIRRTTDGGNTWTNVYTNSGIGFYEIQIHPTNPSIILAGSTKGLLRSIDNGLSWTLLFNEPTCDIKFHPTNFSTIYCLKYNASKKQYQIWKSTNSGQTFLSKLTGWHSLEDGGARIAVTSADVKRIYVIALTNTEGPYLLRSNNEGESWNVQSKGSYTGYSSTTFPMDNWQGYYDLSIMASQTDPNQIITGTGSTFKSSDGGLTFKVIGGYGGDFPLHPDIQSCLSIGSDSWIATDGGLSYSTDFFTETKNAEARNKGLYGSDFWGFDAGWNEKVVVGGRYHNGNTIWHENYQNKFIRMGGAESATGYINPIKNRQVFFSDIGAYQMPELISKNWKWSGIPSSLWPNESYYPMEHSQMTWSPICYNIVYIGNSNKLYKSLNNGASFELLYTSNDPYDNIENIEIARSNPKVIYVSIRNNTTYDGTVYKSVDGGINFKIVTNPQGTTTGQRRVHKIAVSPTDENDLFLALRSGGTSNRVFRSKDGGSTWSNLTSSVIANAVISDMCLQYGTDGGVYIAADDGKIFYKNDHLSDWNIYNNGLGVSHFTRSIKPFYRDGLLLNGSNMGIWEIPLFENSKPLAQPTVDKLTSNCARDTFNFDDYSVLTLDSFSTWNWRFPNAQYVSNKNIRNPKVVFGKIGMYDVTLKIQNRLGESTKTINGMIQISANECGIDSFAGKCLDLSNSSDYATLERIPELKNATGFSCMAWVKLNSKQDCFTQILSNWDSNVGFGFGFAFQGYVQTRNLTFFWKGVPYQLTSPFNLDTLVWVHVAMVVYPDSVRLYRDGISWTYKGNFKDFDLSETPWDVGTGVRGQCGNFQGQIDELKIYNRSLTELEIKENIHLIHPEGENGLVAYYQFNESSNLEIYNRVGGYHAANAGGLKIYSTAPVGSGFSDHKILSTGLNNFPLTKTDVQISTIKEPNSTWFNYKLLNQPDSTLISTGKWNESYYIIRSFENPNSETATSLTFSNTGILLDNYRFAPQFLKLYHRDISNEHLNSWKFVANASSINILNQSIQFNNIQEINGQFIIEVLPNPTRLHDLGNNSTRGIYIYPNPAIGKIQIHTYDLGQTGILKIQDINGNTIYSKSIPSFVQEIVDIHSWPSGVYIVSFNESLVKFVKLD